MLDVQNFFHKVLAVIFAKAQHLYFRRKLLLIGELYLVIPFSSCAFNVCGSYTHFNFFPIQTSIEQKYKRTPLVLENELFLSKRLVFRNRYLYPRGWTLR